MSGQRQERPRSPGPVGAGIPARQIGEITCQVISDGYAPYPAEVLFSGVERQRLEPELGSRLAGDGTVNSQYDCVLLETPSATLLMDAGLGRFTDDGIPAGRLLHALAAAGRAPEDIDVVLISHAHPDHIGGLLTDGSPTFPGARHVMSAVEWDFWSSADNLARMPEPMAAPARATLPPLAAAGLVDLATGETDVVPGVSLVPAPGHTPGHCVVRVDSGGHQLLLLADAVVDVLQVAHPEWVCAFDLSPEETVHTRAKLLTEAAADRSDLFAYHVGEFGQVRTGRRGDSGYCWEHPGQRAALPSV